MTWAGTLTPFLGAAALSNPLLLVRGIQCTFLMDNFLSQKHADLLLQTYYFPGLGVLLTLLQRSGVSSGLDLGTAHTKPLEDSL